MIATAVGQAEGPFNDDWARFNLDLLHLDLAAWSLADGLNDVSVAATKTELEWALAQNKTVIWAPSRMIQNTSEYDRPAALTPDALSNWLVQHLGAPVSSARSGGPVALGNGAPQQRGLAE